MTTLAELAPFFREAFALHSILEQYGIPLCDVYAVYLKDMHTFAIDARQGEKHIRFNIKSGLHYRPDEFTNAWTKAGELWNAAPWSERDRLVKESKMWTKLKVNIVAQLTINGFESASQRRQRGA